MCRRDYCERAWRAEAAQFLSESRRCRRCACRFVRSARFAEFCRALDPELPRAQLRRGSQAEKRAPGRSAEAELRSGGRGASLRRSLLCGRCDSLVHFEDLVAANVFECLNDAAGPADFDGLSDGFRSEAEMDTLVAGREVAAGGRDGCELRALGGDQFYFGADGVAIAFVPHEFQRQPMILRGRVVAQDVNGSFVGGDDGVHATVVVDVAGRQAPAYPGLMEHTTGIAGAVDEALTGVSRQEDWFVVMKIGILQLDSVEVVALGDEKILPAVVVVVHETNAPA